MQGELLSDSVAWLATSLQVLGVPSIYRFTRGSEPVAGWEDSPLQPHWEPAGYRASDFGVYLDWWTAGVPDFEAFLISSEGAKYIGPAQRLENLALEWEEMKVVIAARKARQEKDEARRREEVKMAAKRKERERRRACEASSATPRVALAKLDPNVYGRQQVRAAALKKLRPTKSRLQHIKSLQRENLQVCAGVEAYAVSTA